MRKNESKGIDDYIKKMETFLNIKDRNGCIKALRRDEIKMLHVQDESPEFHNLAKSMTMRNGRISTIVNSSTKSPF